MSCDREKIEFDACLLSWKAFGLVCNPYNDTNIYICAVPSSKEPSMMSFPWENLPMDEFTTGLRYM